MCVGEECICSCNLYLCVSMFCVSRVGYVCVCARACFSERVKDMHAYEYMCLCVYMCVCLFGFHVHMYKMKQASTCVRTQHKYPKVANILKVQAKQKGWIVDKRIIMS